MLPPMPTDPAPSTETTRLIAARDEALRRYAQHLSAVQLKNSRWCAVLSRGGSISRGGLPLAAFARGAKTMPHAH